MKMTGTFDNLRKELNFIFRYRWSEHSDEVRMEKFKEVYSGPLLEEFNAMCPVVYEQWEYWKYYIGRRGTQKLECHFSKPWTEFKEYWQYDTPETKKMFEEMSLLNQGLLDEWQGMYSGRHCSVYGLDYVERKNSKTYLWERFKEKWDENYAGKHEDDSKKWDYEVSNKKYEDMKKYVNEISGDDPRNFYEYCENVHYPFFHQYSILEQYELCQQWEDDRADNNDSDIDGYDSGYGDND